MRSTQLSLSRKVDICPPFLQSAARSHAAPGAMKDERTAVLEWMEGRGLVEGREGRIDRDRKRGHKGLLLGH